MFIKTKLTEKDFINATFVVSLNKPSMKIFLGIMFLGSVLAIINAIFLPDTTYQTFIVPLIILTVFPLITYFTAKKNFAANTRSGEMVEYIFGDNDLVMHGESFNSQLSWEKIYKVTQTKNWILIWQNKQFANLIPRRDIWEGQIEELKEILINHKVKNNL
jgi:hypothetical protein